MRHSLKKISVFIILETFFCFAIFIIISNVYADEASEEKSCSNNLDISTYGDFAYRKTNFSKNDYKNISGWAEVKIVLKNTLKLNPYIKLTPSYSGTENSWESVFVYGGGLEYRPFEDVGSLNDVKFEWIKSFRLYAEYLTLGHMKDEGDQYKHDMRAGIDIWKEWGASNRNSGLIYGELYSDLSWRKTNFSFEKYKTHSFTIVGKIGVKTIDITKQLPLILYAIGELSTTGKGSFWENNVKTGLGVRVIPIIKKPFNINSDIILRVYAEGLRVVEYLKDEQLPNTPDYDLRAGINFSISRH
ncbi:MAG: hypothetical protein L3V56_11845 [Candidatus Magnetoovum sp. WYHC-5]|nr:hypothetical protein [Candidatus Magnetoovum sp. WYHC-5]